MYKSIQLKDTTIKKLDKFIEKTNEGEIPSLALVDYDDAINFLFEYYSKP